METIDIKAIILNINRENMYFLITEPTWAQFNIKNRPA